MLQIRNNNIELTRGDTAQFILSVKKKNGEAYDYSNDLTQFTVKKSTRTEDIVFQKTLVGNTVTINPSDTAGLPYRVLKYDVQIITPDGDVYTVIPPHDFTLTEEVNFNVART